MTVTVAAEGVDGVTGSVTGVVTGVVLGADVLVRVEPALKGAPPLQPNESKHIDTTAHTGKGGSALDLQFACNIYIQI